MPRGQRKEEILRAELPPTLPLMALRSTIVYPLGTIAVQMGAAGKPRPPAGARGIRAGGGAGGRLRRRRRRDRSAQLRGPGGRRRPRARAHQPAGRDDPDHAAGPAPHHDRRASIRWRRSPSRGSRARRKRRPTRSRLDELVARTVTAAETLAELVDRIPSEVPQILKMNVSDPGRFADLAATNMNLRIADKEEVLQRLDIGQRIRFILSRLEREVARARVMDDVKKQTGDQDRAAPARVLSAPAAARHPVGAGRGRSEREGVGGPAAPHRGGAASRKRSRTKRAARRNGCACSRRPVERIPGAAHVPRLGARAAVERAQRRRPGDHALDGRGGARRPALRPRRGEGAHHRVPRRAQAARRRSARARSSASSVRRAPARPRSAKRSPRPSGASSIASRSAACATRPKSAAIAARTWARCRAC